MFEEAKAASIHLLDDRTRCFTLGNGALLTVYASPYTPALGARGFQYHPERGHDFLIDEGVDIAVTHGPPKGIMEYTHGGERAGCSYLVVAVARATPRVYCFGHIHERWGAKFVTWRDDDGEHPTQFTAIDNDRSHVVEKLANLDPVRSDTPQDLEQEAKEIGATWSGEMLRDESLPRR